MDLTLVKYIRQETMKSKTDDELEAVWKENDCSKYSEEAIEAARLELLERGLKLQDQARVKKNTNEKMMKIPFRWDFFTAFMTSLLIIPIAFWGFIGFGLIRGCMNENSVYEDAYSAIPMCKSLGEYPITVFGKVMLLDDKSTDQDQFPKSTSRAWKILGDLVASPQSNDRTITVFIINTSQLTVAGNYGLNGRRALNAQFDIYVVQLPNVQPLGMHTILSTPPPEILSKIGGTPGNVIGNIDDVLHWISKLPRKK